MTGNFTANVNFTTAQITNYNMAVANGANAASITGATIGINPGPPHFSAHSKYRNLDTNGEWCRCQR